MKSLLMLVASLFIFSAANTALANDNTPVDGVQLIDQFLQDSTYTMDDFNDHELDMFFDVLRSKRSGNKAKRGNRAGKNKKHARRGGGKKHRRGNRGHHRRGNRDGWRNGRRGRHHRRGGSNRDRWTCSASKRGVGVFTGRGSSRHAAQRSAMRSCQASGGYGTCLPTGCRK